MIDQCIICLAGLRLIRAAHHIRWEKPGWSFFISLKRWRTVVTIQVWLREAAEETVKRWLKVRSHHLAMFWPTTSRLLIFHFVPVTFGSPRVGLYTASMHLYSLLSAAAFGQTRWKHLYAVDPSTSINPPYNLEHMRAMCILFCSSVGIYNWKNGGVCSHGCLAHISVSWNLVAVVVVQKKVLCYI